jgi:hypothetical protein
VTHYFLRTLTEDPMLKTALFVLSIINTACGLFLAGAYFFANSDGAIPFIALATGIALIIQGGYTVLFAGGGLDAWGEMATQLFVSGETASILAGGLAALQGVLYNLHPRNGDYELLPMSLGIFMVAQAVVGLLYASSVSSAKRAGAIH